MLDNIKVDHGNIGKYLKDKSPYIFVDVADVKPGVSARGKKLFATNEWFFACHFPNNPLVPAVFQLEAIMQTAALCIYTINDKDIDFVYAQKCTNFDVKQPVFPGEILLTEVKIDSFKRRVIKASGEAYVKKDNECLLSCRAEFQMIVPGVINRYSPKRGD